MYTIYCLLDPDSLAIRYIGFTGDVKRRWKEHTNLTIPNGGQYYRRWVLKLKRQGKLPMYATAEEASEAERVWIASAKAAGLRLVNWEDGGVSSKTTRVTWGDKISAAITPDERKRRAEHAKTLKHDWYTPEFRALLSKQRKGKSHRPFTQDERNRIALAHEARKSFDFLESDLGMLLPREQQVIRARFGIGQPALLRQEVADLYCLSKNQVRWTERTALKKLKRAA